MPEFVSTLREDRTTSMHSATAPVRLDNAEVPWDPTELFYRTLVSGIANFLDGGPGTEIEEVVRVANQGCPIFVYMFRTEPEYDEGGGKLCSAWRYSDRWTLFGP